MRRYVYTTCCVISTAQLIDAMTSRAVEITYRTFRKHCNPFECPEMRNYEKDPRLGLTLKKDWHVAYFRSRYDGQPCYYLVHSAIEYIWILQEVKNGRTGGPAGYDLRSHHARSVPGAREAQGSSPRTWTTPASEAWGVGNPRAR